MTPHGPIDKQTLEHLANLSRFSIDGRTEPKLIRDLEKIVDYFQNLRSVSLESARDGRVPAKELRPDESPEPYNTSEGLFEKDEGGYLAVPPVF